MAKLQAGQSGVRIPVGDKYFYPLYHVQSSSGAGGGVYIPPPGQSVRGILLRVESGRDVKLITNLNLVPKLERRGPISLLLYYTFKAYRSRDTPTV